MVRPLFRASSLLAMSVLLMSLCVGSLSALRASGHVSAAEARADGGPAIVGTQAAVLCGAELLAEEVEDHKAGPRQWLHRASLPVCTLPFRICASHDPADHADAGSAWMVRVQGIMPPDPGASLGVLRL